MMLSTCLLCLAVAQPQGRVIWSFEANDGIYSTVTLPDIDGDSLPDVAAAIYYGATPSDPRKVYCLSGADGDTIWVNRTAYGTWGNKALDVSPDLNSDGFAEILLGTAGGYTTPGRSVIAISGQTGDTLWRYTRYEQWGWVYSVRSFADVDSDSVADVVAAAGTSTTPPGYAGAGVLVSGRTGSEIWFFRLPSDAAQCVAPFRDLDSDGIPEVLLGAGGNSINDTLYCLSGRSGSPVWKYKTGGSVSDCELVRDVNGSGTDDAVGGGWANTVYCVEGSTGALIWTSSIGRVVMEIVPVRDLNSDGIDDVIVGSWDSSVRLLSGLDGSQLWVGYLGADVWSVDTLADVNGDGRPEVVAAALNGRNVRLFSGADGSELWFYNFAERVYDVTGAPDLNGDGRPDVLVGLQDQNNEQHHLFCLDGLPPSGIAAPAPAPDLPRLRIRPGGVITVAAPPRARYRLSLFDATGRRRLPPVLGIGSGDVALPLEQFAVGGTLFAVLSVDGGPVATAKFVLFPAAGR
ncbi:MAG: FG-GAP-like repeat-containing protein [candidate division WOR-3 bacterium]